MEDTDDDGLPDPADPNPTTLDEVTASPSEMEKTLAFAAGATLGEFGFPDDEHADSPYYLTGWITLSLVPLVDIPTGVRDLVAAVADGQSFDAALELVGLIPVLGKVGDVTKAADRIRTFVRVFPATAASAQRVVSKVVLPRLPDELNPRIYRAFGADETVSRLRAGGLSDGDLETLAKRLDAGETLDNVVWATKYGDQVIHLTEERLAHIINRHVTGVEAPHRFTSYFPTGDVIKATKKRPRHTLPNRMNVDDIEDSIVEAITRANSKELIWISENSGKPRGLAFKTHNFGKYGIDTMRVVVRPPGYPDSGRIVSAHPVDGPAVDAFNGKKWI